MPKKSTRAKVRDKGEYMTLAQIAEELQIAHASAWTLVVAKRKIPHVRISERIVRVRRSDFKEYLERVWTA